MPTPVHDTLDVFPGHSVVDLLYGMPSWSGCTSAAPSGTMKCKSHRAYKMHNTYQAFTSSKIDVFYKMPSPNIYFFRHACLVHRSFFFINAEACNGHKLGNCKVMIELCWGCWCLGIMKWLYPGHLGGNMRGALTWKMWINPRFWCLLISHQATLQTAFPSLSGGEAGVHLV